MLGNIKEGIGFKFNQTFFYEKNDRIQYFYYSIF